jgi:peptidoglycan hydrolase CwlO-like protein
MMKKLISLLVLVLFAASIMLIAGCGPKGTPKSVLDELSEAKAAAEACDAKTKDLEGKKMDLENQKSAKQAKIGALTKELEALKAEMKIK